MEDLVQKFVGVSPFGCQEDAVVGQNTKTSTGVANGFHGVFNLIGEESLNTVPQLMLDVSVHHARTRILRLGQRSESDDRIALHSRRLVWTYLIQPPLRREDGRPCVVASSHDHVKEASQAENEEGTFGRRTVSGVLQAVARDSW